MKTILLTILATIFYLSIASAQDNQHTICRIIHPFQEAAFSDLFPTTPLPNYEDFLANAWTNGGTPFVQSSLMQFDFSFLPASFVIDSALLSLYGHPTQANPQSSSPLSGSNSSVLRRVLNPWNENTITWSTQPDTVSMNQVILDSSTSIYENYLNIDIKAMTIDMMNFGNYGFMFSLIDTNYYRCLLFASMYNADSTVHPRLKVCYTNTTGIQVIITPPPSSFKIFPSPVNDILNIELNRNSSANTTVQIIDITGRMLSSKTILAGTVIEKIDVSSLAKGVYMISLQSDNSMETGRFVKGN